MNKEQDENIKIFRLHSGEDVITFYEEFDQGVVIINPMVIIESNHKNKFLIKPLLPFRILENNVTLLYSNDIQFIMVPTQTIIDYYLSAVEQVEIEMFESYVNEQTSLVENKSNNSITVH